MATCIAGDLTKLAVDQDGLQVEVVRKAVAPRSAEEPLARPALGVVPLPSNGVAGEEETAEVLRSDVVGIVHFSHPVVAEGALLAEDREVAYVESLGIRNPVSSGGPARVVRVLVTDGQPVEYAQPLFAIERS